MGTRSAREPDNGEPSLCTSRGSAVAERRNPTSRGTRKPTRGTSQDWQVWLRNLKGAGRWRRSFVHPWRVHGRLSWQDRVESRLAQRSVGNYSVLYGVAPFKGVKGYKLRTICSHPRRSNGAEARTVQGATWLPPEISLRDCFLSLPPSSSTLFLPAVLSGR